MSDSRQAGLSRRLNSTNSTNDSSTTTNLGNRLTSLESTTSDQFTQTRAALESTNQNLLDTTSLLEFHTSTDNVTGFNARITALENAPPSTGGGIDPSDPSVRILYQDFLYLSNGNETGDVTPYLLWNNITLTSGLVFNPGNFVYFTPFPNETDHPGILRILHSGDSSNWGCSGVGCIPIWQPAFFGSNETADVLKWSDVSRITIILKFNAGVNSGNDYGQDELYLFGLSTNLNDPDGTTEDGIYFTGTLNVASNWQTVTKIGNTTTTNTTSVALTPGTWYRLDLKRINTTDVEFYINDTLVFTHTTNVPTSNLNLGLSLYSSFYLDELTMGGVNANHISSTLVDFIGVKLGDPETGGALPTGVTVQGTTNEVEVNLASNVYTVGLPPSIIVDQATVDLLNLDTTVTPPLVLSDGQFAYSPDYGAAMTALASTNGNVNCPLGQTLYKEIRNNTGTTITAGQVVYVTGSHAAAHITVALADASTEATAKNTIGVAAHDIGNNSEGWIITQGYLKGIRTNTTSGTGGEGDTLWLSTTAGEFTYDRPSSPDHGVLVGYMVKVGGAGAGAIFVKIANGQELDELHDVYINKSTIANYDIIRWNSSTSRFEVASAQKIFNLPAARLVGRWFGAGTGSLQEITVGTGIDLSNTGVLSTKNVVSDSLTLTAGTGLTGGGDLTANRSFAVDFAASGTSSATKAVRADDVRLADPTDPLSPVLYVEDFLNQNNEAGEIGVQGWNFVNVSLPQMAGELNHPGIVRIRCSATASQVGYMTTALTSAGGTNQFSTDNLKEFTIIFRDVQTELDTYRVYGMCGVATSTTAQFSGIYLRKNIIGVTAGTWEFVTRTTAGGETATTFQTQDTNWHKMKVTYSAGSVSFYMDGATSPNATHVTNIPTGLIVAPYLVLIPTGANLVRTSDWDFISYTLNSITR